MKKKYIGLTELVKRLPIYAEDIKQNVGELFSDALPGLTVKQMYGVALSTGYFLRNEQLLNDIRSEAKLYLDEVDADAAKSAVVITSMASTYYNFSNNTRNDSVNKEPVELHMGAYSTPKISKIDFELYCLAISIIINCKDCINHHIDKLLSLGINKEAISNVARIVAVLRGAKAALEIENIRSYDFVVRGSIF